MRLHRATIIQYATPIACAAILASGCGGTAGKRAGAAMLDTTTTSTSTTTTMPRTTTTTATTVPPAAPPTSPPVHKTAAGTSGRTNYVKAASGPSGGNPAPPPPSGPAIGTVGGGAAWFVNAINGYRARHGRGPLAVASVLVNKANNWAVHMAAGGCGSNGSVPYICHSNLTDGISGHWGLLEENVGMASPSNNYGALEAGFEGSPEHSANMLNGSINYVGVGVAVVGNYFYVAEEFMAA